MDRHVLTKQQRYNGFFCGTLFVISLEDAFVRLPCPDSMYEASTPCESPFFDEELINGQLSPSPALGDMAHSCLISALWGDILVFTARAVHRSETGFEHHYELFYAKTYKKLDAWMAMLPAYLRYSPQNLESSIIDGCAGAFITIHSLYHAAIIRLNRHIRIQAMSAEKLQRNIDQAIRSASEFLSMMHSLAAINRQRHLANNASSEFLYSTPFPGYALMLSIDVLTSAGTFSTLPDLLDMIGTTMLCMDDLVSFWASSNMQQKAMSARLRQLMELAAQEGQGVQNGTYGQYWKLTDSLETVFGNDDAVYKVESHLLFNAIDRLTRH